MWFRQLLIVSHEQLSYVLCSFGAIAEEVIPVIKVRCMARLARVIAVGAPHHVTQRGNARQFILACDADRNVYLELLRQSIALHGVEVIGYCLMSNHVHLVVVPHEAEGPGLAVKNTHGRYAAYWNASHQTGSQVGFKAGVGKGLLDGTRLVSWPLLKGVKCSPSL